MGFSSSVIKARVMQRRVGVGNFLRHWRSFMFLFSCVCFMFDGRFGSSLELCYSLRLLQKIAAGKERKTRQNWEQARNRNQYCKEWCEWVRVCVCVCVCVFRRLSEFVMFCEMFRKFWAAVCRWRRWVTLVVFWLLQLNTDAMSDRSPPVCVCSQTTPSLQTKQSVCPPSWRLLHSVCGCVCVWVRKCMFFVCLCVCITKCLCVCQPCMTWSKSYCESTSALN